MKRKVLIASHAVFTSQNVDVHGSAHAIYDYLLDNKYQVIFIMHPLFGKFMTKIIRNKKETYVKFLSIHPLFRYIQEFFYNILACWNERDSKPLYIGVDPLNIAAGVLARKLGFVEKCVFYIPDFMEKRSENSFLNGFYFLLDWLGITFSDDVWCASPRIIQAKGAQGYASKKFFLLVNAPRYSQLKGTKHNKFHLMCVGNIDTGLSNDLIISAMPTLLKKFPQITLTLIGPNDQLVKEKSLVKKLKLDGKVIFAGVMPHKKLMETLQTGGIGLALYNGTTMNNPYGDSIKIREYLACHLPVITTPLVVTSELIQKYRVGYVSQLRKTDVTHAVEDILGNYPTFTKNMALVRQENDFDKYMVEALKRV